ncbi:two-partner secretion domain-containing protein [aff. Roholtiella sp. LEGE 12411]|uniref:two-partner secretion domain-containing protein n=1 Tax=aff. Roholtiella sp. LEGE 12411 TaxID=1828822 RepID=UPI001881BB17|nr:filamentous hemagglutinin N-terminal domain-containing protein [aff. Roholtiella sp. LEGE 12411]MBE9035215.1 filamentous hemagglutinin N-terminal domain-containing protein [aff. Roholtiella sp. LEGE 12411]
MKSKYQTILSKAVASGLISLSAILPSQAQIKPDMTLPTNTSVKVEGSITTIEGGTPIGQNLFHSLDAFSVVTGSTTQFNNALNVENIITRVTGGSASIIDGLIKANGTANLILLNPSGINFGQNAGIDIGGSFLASTADAIEFGENLEFNAINPQAPPLLAINFPIGLKFRNPNPINVQGRGDGLTAPSSRNTPIIRNSNSTGLLVQTGKNLALVGGGVNIEGGTLVAEGGTISIGSVSSGTVSLNQTDQGWTLGYEEVPSFNDIYFSKQALIDTSGNAGGSINIQGRNVSLNEGAAILIQNQNSPSGRITVKSDESFNLSGISPDGRFTSFLRTESLGSANGGNIDVYGKDLVSEGGAAISSRNYSSGNGGDITVNAFNSIKLIGFSSLNPLFTSSIVSTTTSNTFAKAGDIRVSTINLEAKNGGLISSQTLGNGAGGNVFLTASNSIELTNSIELINSGRPFIPSYLASQTFSEGNAGNLTINTSRMLVGKRAFANTSTLGIGSAGVLTINANNVKVSGSIGSSATRANTDAQRIFGAPPIPSGSPGKVIINTQDLNVTDGGKVSVENEGKSNAGTLTINAGNSILLDEKSSIAASTASGEGGNLSLYAQNNLQLKDSSIITATASGNGNGGNIKFDGGVLAILENSKIAANAEEGQGGNVEINARGVFIAPGSEVTATSDRGVNGRVLINAPKIGYTKEIIALSAIQSPELAQNCTARLGEATEFVDARTGVIPTSPIEDLSSFSGWIDESTPASTSQSQEVIESTENDLSSQLVEVQEVINNGDGTISFTKRPTDEVGYTSGTEALCHRPEESQKPDEQQ